MIKRTLIVAIGQLLLVTVAGAQTEVIDQGTLIVRHGETEVAREQFSLLPGRRGGLTGSTLRATTSYPPVRPELRFNTLLERGTGQVLTAFQVELDGDRTERTVAELARNRLTVRSAAASAEMAHEYPGGEDLVVLDDSVYALWIGVADLASDAGASLRVVFPRTGWRGRIVATRTLGSDQRPSIAVTGDLSATILLDPNGRLSSIQFPAKGIEVLRASE